MNATEQQTTQTQQDQSLLRTKPTEYWIDYLAKEAGISLYKSDYGFGFTGCESDSYDSEKEAVHAALGERLGELKAEWEHDVGETDENRNFYDWLSDEHPLLLPAVDFGK